MAHTRIIHGRVGGARRSPANGALREPVHKSGRCFQGFDSVRNPPLFQRFASRTLQFMNNPGNVPTSIFQLTAAMAAGDEQAIETFYRAYFAWLYQKARHATGRDEAFCLDVVQEAVLRILRCVRPVEGEGPFRAWLRLVVQFDGLRPAEIRIAPCPARGPGRSPLRRRICRKGPRSPRGNWPGFAINLPPWTRKSPA